MHFAKEMHVSGESDGIGIGVPLEFTWKITALNSKRQLSVKYENLLAFITYGFFHLFL